MRHALVISEQGEIEEVDLDNPGLTSLSVLQNAVKGMVEATDLEMIVIVTMWSNDEGKYQADLEYNPYATAFWREAQGIDRHTTGADFIMGPVIFTGQPDEVGETVGLSEAAVQYLSGWMTGVRSNLPDDPRPFL